MNAKEIIEIIKDMSVPTVGKIDRYYTLCGKDLKILESRIEAKSKEEAEERYQHAKEMAINFPSLSNVHEIIKIAAYGKEGG